MSQMLTQPSDSQSDQRIVPHSQPPISLCCKNKRERWYYISYHQLLGERAGCKYNNDHIQIIEYCNACYNLHWLPFDSDPANWFFFTLKLLNGLSLSYPKDGQPSPIGTCPDGHLARACCGWQQGKGHPPWLSTYGIAIPT